MALSAALGIEFGGRRYDCSAGLPADLVGAVAGLLPNVPVFRSGYVTRLLADPGAECVVRGDAVMEYFGYQQASFGHAVGVLLGYLGVVHLLTYAAVVLAARRERR